MEHWEHTLAASGLPDPARAAIRQVVKQRRLWWPEKVEVCHELIAHFQDGLDAGESAEDLLKDFGDAKLAAKLIFRGKERQRPLWWHGFKWVSRGFLALVVVYVGLTVYYAMDRVVIKTDYLAQINAVAMATPEQDRAWPVYREAMMGWPALREEGKWEEVGEEEEKRPVNFAAVLWDDRAVKLGMPAWTILERELGTHQKEIAAFRKGANKPHMAFRVGISGYSTEDLAFFKTKDETAKIFSSDLVGALYAHLNPMMEVSKLLSMDLAYAGTQKDSSRMLKDIHALLGLAQQLNEESVLISQFSGYRIRGRVLTTLANQLAFLDADSLKELADLFRQFPVSQLHFEGERATALSVIQNYYSDDGHGNGHFSPCGTRLVANLNSVRRESTAVAITASLVSTPFCLFSASRKENEDLVNAYYDRLEAETKIPLSEKTIVPYPQKLSAVLTGPSGFNFRFPLVMILLHGDCDFRRSTALAQAQHSALELGIALHRHQLAHHAFPQQLAELVPAYLPQLPVDPITGGPLHYRLDEKWQPIVYSVGGDRQDDGGYAPVSRAGEDDTDATQRWENCKVKGDWILWPMSDRPLMK